MKTELDIHRKIKELESDIEVIERELERLNKNPLLDKEGKILSLQQLKLMRKSELKTLQWFLES